MGRRMPASMVVGKACGGGRGEGEGESWILWRGEAGLDEVRLCKSEPVAWSCYGAAVNRPRNFLTFFNSTYYLFKKGELKIII